MLSSIILHQQGMICQFTVSTITFFFSADINMGKHSISPVTCMTSGYISMEIRGLFFLRYDLNNL